MRQVTVCPDLMQYQQLAADNLADADEESLLGHLERCDACARKLSTLVERDRLVEFIRRYQARGDGAADEVVGRLVERLSKLRPGDTSAAAAQTTPSAHQTVPVAALIIACPACGKGLKVKGELAGKMVKCPHCQQAVCATTKSAGAPARAPVSGISAAALSVPPSPGTIAGAGVQTGVNVAGKLESTVDHQPASAADKELYAFLAPPQAPDELGRLGPYRVLKILGAGGMGVVFRAEDPQLMRLVALKAMLPALAASASARQRFLREARAAAAINHDHIVSVHQVGEDRGVPYLAMQFLEGEPLDARLQRAGKLPVAEVLRIGREIALGLAAANQRGLIHRDIKPANIWLEKRSGEPGASATGGRVKILDFGLARAVGAEAQLTQLGAVVGTPAYMAPEQGKGKAVDHRCDLFSLGCVLYHMATGKPAFRGTDVISTLMAVATEHPRPPHELDAAMPPALSELIMGLLAKAPGDRPPSAQAVAETLEGIAAVGAASRAAPTLSAARLGSPVVQTSPRRWKKWPLMAGLAACLLLGLTGLWSAGVFKLKTKDGTIVLANLPADAEVFVDGEKVALKLPGDDKPIEIQVTPGKRRLEIKTAGFKMETRDVELASGERKPIGIRLEPKATVPETPAPPVPLGAEEKGFVPLFNAKDLTGWKTHPKEPGNWRVEKGILVGSGPTKSHLYSVRDDFSDFHLRLEARINDKGDSGVLFRAPYGLGQWPANKIIWLLGYEAQIDNTGQNIPQTGSLYTGTDGPVVSIRKPPAPANEWFTLEIIAEENHIVIKVGGKTTVDFTDPKRLYSRGHLALQQFDPQTVVEFRKIEIKELAGTKIKDALPTIVSPPPPSKELEALRREQLAAEVLKWAGDGDPNKAPASLVAVLGEAQPIHSQAVLGLAYSPDGRWLASGSADKTIMLREAATGRVKRILTGHTAPVAAVGFSKDGRTLVSAGHDGTLRLWSVDKDEKPTIVEAKLGQPVIQAMAVSPDGRFVAAAGNSGLIKLWKWGAWEKPIEIADLRGKVTIRALAFSPDGELLACGGGVEGKEQAARVRIYATADGTPKGSMPFDTGGILALSFSHDGKHLAAVGANVNSRVWEVASGKQVAVLVREAMGGEWPDSFCVAWSPDDKTLAVGEYMKLAVYDFPTGTKRIGRFGFTRGEGRGYESEPIRAVAFSPRGDMLAAAGPYGDVPVWDTTNWKLQYLERGHRHTVRTVAVSPDGGELLSLGDGAALLRWPLARPREPVLRPLDFRKVAPPFSASLVSPAVAYSHDGRTSVITWHSGMAVRNTVADKETVISAAPVFLQNPAVSPDGRIVAAGGGDGYLHLWDLALGREVHRFSTKGRWCGLAFSRDSKFLGSCNEETKRVTIWNVVTGAEGRSWEVQSVSRVSAFSPQGQIVATGHDDGSILLWDSATGQKKRALAGHSARIRALKFTPDGKTLVSSGDDGIIRLWNPENVRAREVIPLGPANRPLIFDLDPSGKYLIAASHSPVIFVLRLPLGDGRASSEKTESPVAGTGPVDAAWLKEVAALPAAQQVQAVAAKLKDLNPGFDSPLSPVIEGGVVTELHFDCPNVKDISPLRALPGLRTLAIGHGPLSDLSPLKGMPLTHLACGGTRVSDLSPLKDMKLTELHCPGAPVSDLTPLKGMPLTWLNCDSTRVSDLTPLKGMPLNRLSFRDSPVSDLSPLKDVKLLKELWCSRTQVSDLSPIKDMKLTVLQCDGAQVTGTDLAPLQEMSSLVWLVVGGPKMTDAGLEHLDKLCDLEVLDVTGSKLNGAGLVHLKRMTRLKDLKLDNTELTDQGLVHLKGLLGLRGLGLRHTRVTDAGLEHLAGLKDLVFLDLGGTAVTDKGVAKFKTALPKCNIIR